MSRVVGYYTDDKKKVRPVSERKSKRGYNAKPTNTVEHRSKYTKANISKAEAMELHRSRSSRAQAIDEAIQAKIVEPGEWASDPSQSDVEGIDTKGAKDLVPVPPLAETVERWEKVHDTSVVGEHSENEIDKFGMVLEPNHVSGLVVEPNAAIKNLGKFFKDSNVKERYEYLSLDAINNIDGQGIIIGGSLYDKDMVARSIKVLGQENIKFRTKGENSVLIIENKRGEVITLAPCIGTPDKTKPGYKPTPELKKINMGKATEKAYRKAKRAEHKTKREGMIQLVRDMNEIGYDTSNKMPYDWSKDGLEHKYKTPESQGKFLKNNYGKGSGIGDNFVSEAAERLYGRREHWGFGSGRKKNVVTYEKEPPQWFKDTYGKDLDKGSRVVTESEYKMIVARDASTSEKRRERSAKKQRNYEARMKGLEEKKQAARERAKKADNAWWKHRGKKPKEAERQKRLYHKNVNKMNEIDRDITNLREEAREKGYYI